MWGRISSAPSAQFKPTVSGWAWRIECQNAVGVWPDSVRPERSVIVPEIISGSVRAGAGERTAGGDDRRLCVERVEDRLDQQQVDAALDQRVDLLLVGGGETGERDRAVARVLDARRDRQRHVRRADRAGHEPRPAVATVRLLRRLAGDSRGGDVHVVDDVGHGVVALGDARAGERVRLDDVGARQQVVEVDRPHRVGLGEHEQVVVAGEVVRVVLEPIGPEVVLAEPEGLDHGAHRAVEHEDPLTGELGDRVIGERVGAGDARVPGRCEGCGDGHATPFSADCSLASQTVTVSPSSPEGGARSRMWEQPRPDASSQWLIC